MPRRPWSFDPPAAARSTISAPEYVPVLPLDAPPIGDLQHFPPPRRPVVRPNEQATIPQRPGFGTPCPNAGYALRLGRVFEDRVELTDGERARDAMAAGNVLALKRAGRIGRGPILADVEVGLTILGYLGSAPDALLAWRADELFGIATDYHLQRRLADRVTDDDLAQPAAALRARLGGWRQLLGVPGRAGGASRC